MSIEEVAARAGVGKATIYRRWSSKGLLALDAFMLMFREQQPPPDTGSLREDLIAALRAWVRAVTSTPAGRLLTSLIAAAQQDPELHAAWRDRVLEPLRTQHRMMIARAVARGEMPASVDADVVLDLFFGGAEHRLLLGHLPMPESFITSVVDVILNGVVARDLLLRVLGWNDGLGFDLDQPGRIEQAGDYHRGRHRADRGEDLTMRAGDLRPVLRAGEEDASPDHVLQARARLHQRLADQVQAQHGLGKRPIRGR
jgi:AcrR family transcriptional regulator